MKYTTGVSAKLTRRLYYCAIVLVITAGAGCASLDSPKKTDDISALKENVWTLKKQTAELGLKVSDIINELSILKERLKSVSDESGPAREAQEIRVISHPPVSAPEEKNIQAKDARPQETDEAKAAPKAGAALNNSPTPRKSDIILASSATPAPVGRDFKGLGDDEMYRRAMDMFNGGKYSKAAAGFSFFVRRYPASHLTSNAQYWLGEAFYSQKNYARAAIEFKKALARYPGSLKTPDTMLKLGFCKIKLNLFPEGKKVLRKVIDKYPLSVAASTARRELEKVNKNGKEMSGDS